MRNIYLLFTLAVALAFPGAVQAQFVYDSSGTNVIVVGYFGSGGAVTIPTIDHGLPITGIAQGAFRNCIPLTSVTMGNNIASIGQEAFDGCVNLAGIAIPGSVTNIGGHAFDGCESLMAIPVDPQNLFYSSLDGVLLNKNQTTLIECPGGLGEYTIPGSVTSIAEAAFWTCRSLTNLTLGNSVTNIGMWAFGYTALTDLTVPDGVPNIGPYTFYQCFDLTNVTIGTGVTNLGANAFGGCVSLTSVTIPGSVASIGTNAFDYCTNLAGVYFTGDAPTADSSVFFRDTNANVFYLPGTTGWGSIFGGIPATPWIPHIQVGEGSAIAGVQSGQFGFSFAGPKNIAITVEASPSLAAPVWNPVQTVTLTNGFFHFSEPVQTDSISYFYRLSFP